MYGLYGTRLSFLKLKYNLLSKILLRCPTTTVMLTGSLAKSMFVTEPFILEASLQVAKADKMDVNLELFYTVARYVLVSSTRFISYIALSLDAYFIRERA